MQQLSICTYNCNSLPHVHQYTSDNRSIAGVLQALGADIVCFQETKLAGADLCPVPFERIAGVPGWDSYFCFTRKGGYSGVATYVKTAASTVRAAEEGLLRVLPPQNPVSAAAQHVAAAPGCPPAAQTADAGTQAAAASATTAWPREIVFPAKQLRAMFTPEEALAVDKDGRCIITDHGLFVLFNTYWPACTGNNGFEQVGVKRNMWRAVDVRMRTLLAAGRHVVLAGDMNVALPWWGQEGSKPSRGGWWNLSAVETAPLQSQQQGAAAVTQDAEQQEQQQQQQQREAGVQAGTGGHPAQATTPAELGETVQQQQQPGLEASSTLQPTAQGQLRGPAQGMLEGATFAPHADYRKGKPVLPSSGLSEWLMQLCTPAAEADSSAAPSGTALPATGVLIDTLKHLNPGVKTFRYPDAKKPGRFKERLPYTAWSPMRNIRNDQHGARSDYIFVADAAEYAAQLQQLQQQQHTQQQQRQPSAAVPEQGPQMASPVLQLPPPQQQLQQQHDAAHQEAFNISMRAALFSAFILRELRWTDHAPVVLQLSLPAHAASILRSPAADAALQPVRQQPLQQPQAPTAGTHSAPATPAKQGASNPLPADLPCPLSSYWLLHPSAAGAAAAAVLAAAGVDRVPAHMLTCSITQQLRETLYAAATEVIAARAQQLYGSGAGAAAGPAAGDASAAPCSAEPGSSTAAEGAPGRTDLTVPAGASVPAAAQQQEASQHTMASSNAAAAGHSTAADLPWHTPSTAVPTAAAGSQPEQRWRPTQQRHPKQQQRRRPGANSAPATPAVCGKRKDRRGWRVVKMSNGRTATVACSSSDSEG